MISRKTIIAVIMCCFFIGCNTIKQEAGLQSVDENVPLWVKNNEYGVYDVYRSKSKRTYKGVNCPSNEPGLCIKKIDNYEFLDFDSRVYYIAYEDNELKIAVPKYVGNSDEVNPGYAELADYSEFNLNDSAVIWDNTTLIALGVMDGPRCAEPGLYEIDSDDMYLYFNIPTHRAELKEQISIYLVINANKIAGFSVANSYRGYLDAGNIPVANLVSIDDRQMVLQFIEEFNVEEAQQFIEDAILTGYVSIETDVTIGNQDYLKILGINRNIITVKSGLYSVVKTPNGFIVILEYEK